MAAKEARGNRERDDEVDGLQDGFPLLEEAAPPMAERRQRGAQNQRHEHQETQDQHPSE